MLIAVSESEAEVFGRIYPEGRVTVVPNGIPVGPEPLPPLPDPPAMVSVSRFVYPKDPLLAVRVMAGARREVPGARALLVGYGELEYDVRRLVASLDPGIAVRSDIPGPEAVAGATVVLLCTRREGGPIVPLEAMERGRAVVANDVVGCRDVVVHGETGYLFPVGDVDAGVRAVAGILADPAQAAGLGAAGRARLVARYSVEAMADGVDRVDEAVVRKRKR